MKEIKPAAYKTSEAAAYLNISEKVVRDMADTGELECLRLGNARYFTVASLDAFIAKLPKWADDNGHTAQA
jgi:excisionase family DNA binding protein